MAYNPKEMRFAQEPSGGGVLRLRAAEDNLATITAPNYFTNVVADSAIDATKPGEQATQQAVNQVVAFIRDNRAKDDPAFGVRIEIDSADHMAAVRILTVNDADPPVASCGTKANGNA